MGWGLGFDKALKPYISGTAKIFLNTERMSPQVRNSLYRAVETLWLPDNTYSRLHAIARDCRLSNHLPMIKSYQDLRLSLPDEANDELVATAALFNYKLQRGQYWNYVGPRSASESDTAKHLEANKLLNDLLARFSLEHRVPGLPDEYANRRIDWLWRIKTKGIITLERTF